MSRTDMMARLLRLARLAEHCDRTGQPADEALGADRAGDEGRRNFAKGVLAATTVAAAWSVAPGALAKAKLPPPVDVSPGLPGSGDVAIIGAGLAGLTCAYELGRLGHGATVFEASGAVGGRVASLRDTFSGHVVERGGEFIGASHHAMIGYARELGLQLENVAAQTGDAYYQLAGGRYSEAQVLEEYRAFAASVREDLRDIGAPTADQAQAGAELFDLMSIDDYLTLHQAGPLLRGLVSGAYLAEFGTPIDSISAISFIRFVQGDARAKQSAFGGGNGQLRVVGGADQIATGLAARLAKPVQLGHRLVAARLLSSGYTRLTFDVGGTLVDTTHSVVVMALPFTVLRDVDLHANLGLPDWKLRSIRSAVMGDHSKLALAFNEPVWRTRHGLSGTGLSDRASLQSTWEAGTLAGRSGQTGVLAGHFGGDVARRMGPASLATDAEAFLSSLEGVMPGARAAALRDGQGRLAAHVDNWSANPLSKGSVPSNRPGYFTHEAHLEAKPIGSLLFAGDHTSSYYEWQGFMEGAALSGLRSAGEVLARGRVDVGTPVRMPGPSPEPAPAPIAPAPVRSPAPSSPGRRELLRGKLRNR